MKQFSLSVVPHTSKYFQHMDDDRVSRGLCQVLTRVVPEGKCGDLIGEGGINCIPAAGQPIHLY